MPDCEACEDRSASQVTEKRRGLFPPHRHSSPWIPAKPQSTSRSDLNRGESNLDKVILGMGKIRKASSHRSSLCPPVADGGAKVQRLGGFEPHTLRAHAMTADDTRVFIHQIPRRALATRMTLLTDEIGEFSDGE